jgi:hypothetical protein
MDGLLARSQRASARARKASKDLDKTLHSIGMRQVRTPVIRRAKQLD